MNHGLRGRRVAKNSERSEVVMFSAVHFKNFKALRDTTLPLSPFTLILGANGSGKSTALQAIRAAALRHPTSYEQVVSVGPQPYTKDDGPAVQVTLDWASPKGIQTQSIWSRFGQVASGFVTERGQLSD